jgi:hypothetical protein
MVQANPAQGEQQPWKAVIEDYHAWLAVVLDHVPS